MGSTVTELVGSLSRTKHQNQHVDMQSYMSAGQFAHILYSLDEGKLPGNPSNVIKLYCTLCCIITTVRDSKSAFFQTDTISSWARTGFVNLPFWKWAHRLFNTSPRIITMYGTIKSILFWRWNIYSFIYDEEVTRNSNPLSCYSMCQRNTHSELQRMGLFQNKYSNSTV